MPGSVIEHHVTDEEQTKSRIGIVCENGGCSQDQREVQQPMTKPARRKKEHGKRRERVIRIDEVINRPFRNRRL
jgi:hypothetical protein